ncbi:Spore cortex-lytic enzyme [bacterium HR40]|nr:Spore cortex-lytic enzyme [bacterium HR40]
MLAGEPLELLRALAMFVAGGEPSPARLRDISCLATNVWFEARGSPFVDKLAVAQVVVNRVRDPARPNSVCGVVFEPHQFSWTSDERPDHVRITNRIEREAWLDSVLAAITALDGRMPDLAAGATHFHNPQVSPAWAAAFEYVARWGGHRYYRPAEPAARKTAARAGERDPPPGPRADAPRRGNGPAATKVPPPRPGERGLALFWRYAAPLGAVVDSSRAAQPARRQPFAWLQPPATWAGLEPTASPEKPRGNTGRP